MDPKPRPNHRLLIETLRRMTAEEKLRETFALSEMTRDLFRRGLRERFPDLSEEALHALFLKRLELCHNRNC